MFSFTIFLILAISSVSSVFRPEVASQAQIRFAESQNYDKTGPGADVPEHIYKTFTNLDDALISFADDPDTKLPETERFKAFLKLGRPVNIDYTFASTIRPTLSAAPSRFSELLGYHHPVYQGHSFQHDTSKNAVDLKGLRHIHVPEDRLVFADKEPFKMEKIRYLKESPINIAHFSRLNTPQKEQFIDGHSYNRKPEYVFSYGVHDRDTGDSKSAKESLQDGVVRGYYTVMDPDGKQRTVHYTADDRSGFQAVVQRTKTNRQ